MCQHRTRRRRLALTVIAVVGCAAGTGHLTLAAQHAEAPRRDVLRPGGTTTPGTREGALGGTPGAPPWSGGLLLGGRRGGRPAAATGVQESRCADCHFANPDAPGRDHLLEWDASPHGRAEVGCETCHGGDATSFDAFRAHREIRVASDPAAPTHRTNLPATCGRCHAGPYVAFQESVHHRLLETEDDPAVPVCTTCHGTVGAHLLSPARLASRCASCHGTDAVAPRVEYPAEARLVLEEIEAVGDRIEQARDLLERVEDAGRRDAYQDDLRQAEVPWMEAVDAGHAFDVDLVTGRLGTARRRIERLLDALVIGAGTLR